MFYQLYLAQFFIVLAVSILVTVRVLWKTLEAMFGGRFDWIVALIVWAGVGLLWDMVYHSYRIAFG